MVLIVIINPVLRIYYFLIVIISPVLMMYYFLIVALRRCVDETNSNCDTKEKVDDETSSSCDTCLVEDESIRLGGKSSRSFYFANHDHTCQLFCLENVFF